MTNVAHRETFMCAACRRSFQSTPEDVKLAGGHLCIAMDAGLTQHEALRKLAEAPEEEEDCMMHRNCMTCDDPVGYRATREPAPPQSAEPRGQEMTFDQWYGNRPVNRKQVSREVWYAALAHAPELAGLRADRDSLLCCIGESDDCPTAVLKTMADKLAKAEAKCDGLKKQIQVSHSVLREYGRQCDIHGKCPICLEVEAALAVLTDPLKGEAR